MKKKTEEDLMSAYVASEETPVTKSPFTDAKVEADAIIKNAESEAKKLIAQGESSLSQSARNVRLSLKDELNEMFSKALNKSLSETLSASDYVEIIKCALSSVQDEEKTLLLSDKLSSQRLLPQP